MTVGEMIEKLGKFDPKKEICAIGSFPINEDLSEQYFAEILGFSEGEKIVILTD